MSESSLSITLSKLQAEVGHFLGYGRGTTFSDRAWTTRQQTDIDFVIDSGLRQFYFATPMSGEVVEWSFLKPALTLTLASGDQTVNLPDDFAGFVGDALTVVSSSTSYCPVPVYQDGLLDKLYSDNPTMTGRPELAAVRALKGTGARQANRYELYVYPEADQDYSLRLIYFISPDTLNVKNPHPYGGAAHAETIREACLMAAENFLDDQVDGPHSRKFAERLAASINADRRHQPRKLGYNGDRSDERRYRYRDGYTVTFDGVSP